MPTRKPNPRITPPEAKDLIAATHYASTIRRPLNTFVAINPKLLTSIPSDVGVWVRDEFLNRVRVFMSRLRIGGSRSGGRKVGYYGVWVRENYEGPGREHVHLLVHCPADEREKLAAALRRSYPGTPDAVYVEPARYGRNFITGRHMHLGLVYILKQASSRAWYGTGKQIQYEKACRHTGAPVAAVLGKRCGVSRSLGEKAREAYKSRPGSFPAPTSVTVATTAAEVTSTGLRRPVAPFSRPTAPSGAISRAGTLRRSGHPPRLRTSEPFRAPTFRRTS